MLDNGDPVACRAALSLGKGRRRILCDLKEDAAMAMQVLALTLSLATPRSPTSELMT